MREENADSMKIVFDTNVLISALIKEGNPRQLLFKIIKSKHQLIISREIMEELAVTTTESRICKYMEESDISDFIRNIAMTSKVVEVMSKFNAVKEDPDDDIMIRTAFDGHARYIVSGDRHLLELKRFRGVRIVTVEEMLHTI